MRLTRQPNDEDGNRVWSDKFGRQYNAIDLKMDSSDDSYNIDGNDDRENNRPKWSPYNLITDTSYVTRNVVNNPAGYIPPPPVYNPPPMPRQVCYPDMPPAVNDASYVLGNINFVTQSIVPVYHNNTSVVKSQQEKTKGSDCGCSTNCICYLEKGQSVSFYHWDEDEVNNQISDRQSESTLINQLPLDLCGMAIVAECLAFYDKEGYRKVVQCLYKCGYIEHINLNSAKYIVDSQKAHVLKMGIKKLQDIDPHKQTDRFYLYDAPENDETKPGRGSGMMAAADFILLCSLRWNENKFMNYFVFDQYENKKERNTAITMGNEIVHLLKDFVGLDHVTKMISPFFNVINPVDPAAKEKCFNTLRAIQKFYDNDGYVVLFVNGNLFDKPVEYANDEADEKYGIQLNEPNGDHFVRYYGG